jgi:hypothetical protein
MDSWNIPLDVNSVKASKLTVNVVTPGGTETLRKLAVIRTRVWLLYRGREAISTGGEHENAG